MEIDGSSFTQPIAIRFIGPDLKQIGVSITDLGKSLVAIQRMIYKVYAIELEMQKSSNLSESERFTLALYLSDRQKKSDLYLFEWASKVLSGFPQELVYSVGTKLFESLSTYTWEWVSNITKKRQIEKKDRLALITFNELETLADRVGDKRGIARIEIYLLDEKKPIIIDENTKNMIAELKNKTIPGQFQELVGWISLANMEQQDWLEINASGRKIRVHTKKELFDYAMDEYVKNKDKTRKKIFKILGTPRLIFGRDIYEFIDFDATEIVSLAEQRKK